MIEPEHGEADRSAVERPIRCRITVQGEFSTSWWRYADRLQSERGHRGGAPTTTLSGLLADEDELLWVLNALYEMHLPIMEVSTEHQDQPPPIDPAFGEPGGVGD